VRWLTDQGFEASAFATEYGQDDDELPGALGDAVAAAERAAEHVAESVGDIDAARIVVAPEDAPVDDAGA